MDLSKITLGQIMKYGTGAVTIIGSISAVIIWFSSAVVWAGDYQNYQQQTTGTIIEMRIDMLESRIERLRDRYRGRKMPHVAIERINYYLKKIKRLESQQESLDKKRLGGDS